MTTKPSAQASRAEHTRRINRVLNYIDAHLDQPLDGAHLADIANFSRFHFHRVFAAWMGGMLGSYGPAIGEFWRGTIAPWMHSNGFSDQPCYGIGYDDPLSRQPTSAAMTLASKYPRILLPAARWILKFCRVAVMP